MSNINNNICDFCGRTFFSEGSLRYHRRNTHLSTTKRPFKCPHCPAAFVRPAFLKYHLRTHVRGQVGGEQVQCSLAPSGHLVLHPGVIAKGPPATPKLINPAQNTAEKEEARNHSYTYKCSCSKYFEDLKNLRFHANLYEHHYTLPDSDNHHHFSSPAPTNSRDRSNFDCPKCSKSLSSKHSLKLHLMLHNRQQLPYICPTPGCSKSYQTSGNLQIHQKRAHKLGMSGYITSLSTIKCPLCPKYVVPHRLPVHLVIHSNDRPMKCHLCERSFKTKLNLASHVKGKHGILPPVISNVVIKRKPKIHGCKNCENKYTSQVRLERHIRMAHSQGEGQEVKGNNMQWVEEEQAEKRVEDDDIFLSPPHLSLPPAVSSKKSLGDDGDFSEPPLLTPQDSPMSFFPSGNDDHDDDIEKEESESEGKGQLPKKEYYEPLIVTGTASLTPRKSEIKGKVIKTTQKLNFIPNGIWYQCQICKVLIESERKFITHKRSHMQSKKAKVRKIVVNSPQDVPKDVPIHVDNSSNGERDLGFQYVPGFPTNRITTIKQEPM